MSTSPWEQRKPRGQASTQLEQPIFTSAELAGLLAFCAHMQRCSVDLKLGLDDRRLEFVRWLVEHSRLNEELE
jgi:hypothetical protein